MHDRHTLHDATRTVESVCSLQKSQIMSKQRFQTNKTKQGRTTTLLVFL
jgi:hypothetical protein